MADRRPPGFNVDLGFYESPEVLSIPRRVRAHAVGVWTLCGSFSANNLTDGYISEEKLKQFGCTPVIREALEATRDANGELSPLWVEASHGGVQFTRWPKWQRTRAEVKAYLKREAERKKRSRNAIREASSSEDAEMSGRTNGGRKPDVRVDDGDPRGRVRARQTETETETETERSGYLPESATDPNGPSGIAATPAAVLVHQTIPRDINAATQTALRFAASTLLKDGTPTDVVEEALRDWASKTGIGPRVLPSLAADVIKRRNGHARDKPASKIRGLAELAQAERARESENGTHHPQELE